MKRWTASLAISFILFLFHSPVFSKSIKDTVPPPSLETDSRIVSGLDADWQKTPSPFAQQSGGFTLKIGDGRQGQIVFPAVLDAQNPLIIQIQNDTVQQALASGGTGGLFIARNQGALSKLTTMKPRMITSGDFDGTGQDDLVFDFGGTTGVYIYLNDASAMLLTKLSPVAMASGDLNSTGQDDLIISFDGIGTMAYKDMLTKVTIDPKVARAIVPGNLNGY